MKLYVDMDGTLTKWESVPIEVVASKGYFRNLTPEFNVLRMVRRMIAEDNGIEVFILSAVFQDDHSVCEKKEWLHEFLPEMAEENMVFVPYGEKKGEYVREAGAFLLDDFSRNLHEWEGVGVKIYNGINGTHGTWSGYSIRSDMESDTMYRQLLGIINMGVVMR